MAHFAKIFNLSDEDQVLVQRYYNDEDDHDIVEATTMIGGVRIQAKMGFEIEESADHAFERYNQEKAEEWRNAVSKMFDEE